MYFFFRLNPFWRWCRQLVQNMETSQWPRYGELKLLVTMWCFKIMLVEPSWMYLCFAYYLLVSGKFKDDASSATSCEHYLCAEFCSLGQVALNYLICKGALPIAGYVTSTFSPKLQMGFFCLKLDILLGYIFFILFFTKPRLFCVLL